MVGLNNGTYAEPWLRAIHGALLALSLSLSLSLSLCVCVCCMSTSLYCVQEVWEKKKETNTDLVDAARLGLVQLHELWNAYARM